MAERPSAGEYLANIRTEVPKMVAGIKELAEAEVKPAVKQAGVGTGLVGAAAVIGGLALLFVVISGAFGIGLIFVHFVGLTQTASMGLGFLIAGVLWALVALIVLKLGLGRFKKVKAPELTIAEARASFQALSDSIGTGIVDARLGVVDRRGAVVHLPEGDGATEARYAADPGSLR